MLRKWANKFSRTLNERVVARRKAVELPLQITLDPDKNTGSLLTGTKTLSIKGITRDLSNTGIAFVVPSIRVEEAYLVGEGRVLNAEISLPSGKVKMQLKGERYKQIGDEHLSISEYMVGASIVNISAGDRAKYDEFLKGSRVKHGSLNLGVDKSKA